MSEEVAAEKFPNVIEHFKEKGATTFTAGHGNYLSFHFKDNPGKTESLSLQELELLEERLKNKKPQ